jgi:D-arabinose 1-dehydrogenase-like Zn-dependent alcohol dehydrogenase
MIETHPLEAIDNIFSRLKKDQVNGRIVLELGAETRKPIARGQATS